MDDVKAERAVNRNGNVSDDLLVKVSWWYHFDGLTQDQIAERLGTSRPSVSRMIERAKAEGITRVHIAPAYLSRLDICTRVRDRYGLREVVLLPPSPDGDDLDAGLRTRLGMAGMHTLVSELEHSQTLAIGWGETVAQIMSQLPGDELSHVDVVSLTGGVNVYANAIHQNRSIGESSMRIDLVPTPLFVSSEKLARALQAEDSVSRTLTRARQADVALISVGAPSGEASLWRMGGATPEELDEVLARGGVGDVLGVFYDADGNPLDLERNRRRIGVGIDALRDIDTVIGVAGGAEKHQTIRGALKGRYIDILVTDLNTLEFLA